MTTPDYVFKPFKVTKVKFRNKICPRHRSGHRIACDDSNIYCFGGYDPVWNPTSPLFKEMWTFSIASRTWKHTIIENMPNELASNAMCMNGRYLMIYGGTGYPFGIKCSNDVFVWDTSKEDDKLLVFDIVGDKPPGLYGQAITYHNGSLFSIGGTNGLEFNCDIYRLDFPKLEWEAVFVGTGQDDEPLGRYRHEVIRHDNKFYVLGGGTSVSSFDLMEIPMYDIEKKMWSTIIPKADNTKTETRTPQSRRCHSAVQIDTPNGTQVFVVGGIDGDIVYRDIWRLTIPEMEWCLMKKSVVPQPLYFHSSAVTSYGCMYMFGGITPKYFGNIRLNVMYKMWLCIPKLSEICWEAVLSIHPHIDQLDRKTLLNIGIPIHLVNRIHPET